MFTEVAPGIWVDRDRIISIQEVGEIGPHTDPRRHVLRLVIDGQDHHIMVKGQTAETFIKTTYPEAQQP